MFTKSGFGAPMWGCGHGRISSSREGGKSGCGRGRGRGRPQGSHFGGVGNLKDTCWKLHVFPPRTASLAASGENIQSTNMVELLVILLHFSMRSILSLFSLD